MKKIFLILFTAYSLSLTAQQNNHIFINRGSTTVLTWNAAGDYSGYDSLYFAVKACTTINCGRLSDVSKSCGVSYTEPYTTITCTLYAANTSGLNAAKYYYSIYAYGSDTVWITSGNFNLQLNGQTVADGIATTGPVHIIALDSSNKEPGIPIFRDSDNSMTYLSYDELGDSMDIVDKTSLQTITAQKNFLGNAKFGADTTIQIGKTEGSYRTALDWRALSGTYAGGGRIFKMTPYDQYTAPWVLATAVNDFIPDSQGVDHSINLGYNWNGDKPTLPQFGMQLEGNYEFEPNTDVYEYFFYYSAPYAQFDIRPFALTVYKPNIGQPYNVESNFNTAQISFSAMNLEQRIHIMTPNIGEGGIFFRDTMRIQNDIRDVPWLYQKNSAGGFTEIVRINAQNRVYFPNSNGIRIDNSIYGNKDTLALRLGVSTFKNTGLQFYTTTDQGAFWWNGQTKTFGMSSGASAIDDPDDWQSFHQDNWKANLFVGGNIAIGIKNFGNSVRSLIIGYTSSIPNPYYGSVALYATGNTSYPELFVATPGGGWGMQLGRQRLGTVNDQDVILQRDSIEIVTLKSGGVKFHNLTGSAQTDGVLFYSTDLSAGNTIPSYYTEGTGLISSLGYVANRYNGTVRYFPSYTSVPAFSFPITDGTSGQVLKTNGSGVLTWQNDATGAGGAAYADSVTHDGRHVPGDSLITDAEGYSRFPTKQMIADSNFVLTSETSAWDKNASNDLLKSDSTIYATQFDISQFITDGNTNWDNSYGFITDGNTNWDNTYGYKDSVWIKDAIVDSIDAHILTANDATPFIKSISNVWTAVNKATMRAALFTNVTETTTGDSVKFYNKYTFPFTDGTTNYVLKTNGNGEITWQSDATGGSPTWGSITGTLSDQTDLQSALNLKLNITTLNDSNFVLTSETSAWDKNASNDVTTTMLNDSNYVLTSETSNWDKNAADDTVGADASPTLGGDLEINDKSLKNTTPTFNISATELGYLDGVTSAIQTQLNGKQASGTYLIPSDSTAQRTFSDLKYAPKASPTFTGTVTIPTPFTLGAVSVLPTGTELNFVDGVTSAIQTQLNGKQASGTYLIPSDSTAQRTFSDLKYAPKASPTFTGTVTIPTPFTLGAVSVLPTGTELNFVDGVTSAIQTQLDSKTTMSAVYPVGSIYISTVSTNPATLLGVGTWAAFGTGRVLIGIDAADPDFDTVEETGGTKTHDHSVTSNVSVSAHASHTHTVTSNVTIDDHTLHNVELYSGTPQLAVVDGDNIHNASNNQVTSDGPGAPLTHSVTNNAVTSASGSSVQPYIVVYIWKRTS